MPSAVTLAYTERDCMSIHALLGLAFPARGREGRRPTKPSQTKKTRRTG